MSTKKQRKEQKKAEERINLYEFECPKVDELSDYVNCEMKSDKEKNLAIEEHIFGADDIKGCTDCFKHVASLNGASQTLIDCID